jgi:hypothetical protein
MKIMRVVCIVICIAVCHTSKDVKMGDERVGESDRRKAQEAKECEKRL